MPLITAGLLGSFPWPKGPMELGMAVPAADSHASDHTGACAAVAHLVLVAV